MTTVLDLKKDLAKIQDITQDPDFENKPIELQADLLIREEELRTDISLALINIKRSRK